MLAGRGCARALGPMVLCLFVLFASLCVLADEQSEEKPEDWEQQLERLRSVPYISFSENAFDESDSGVVFHNSEKAYDGYNLYCTRWTGKAFLLDMHGRVAHRWAFLPIGGSGSYHHVDMLENGDLLVIKEYRNLLRLNWESDLIWKTNMAVHHDVVQGTDGSLYTIVRERKDHRGMNVWFDAIVHLTADGKVLNGWSTYHHLNELKGVLDKRSFLDTILDSILVSSSSQAMRPDEIKREMAERQEGLDYFHLNSVSVLPATVLGERDSRFRMGNLLICSRHVNQVAVLERDTYRVLWAWGEGQLEWPHHATMLQNGHVLIFDNGIHREYSRVLELDPISRTIVWEYSADPPEDFFSKSRGSVQRLPNGNTLICDSDNGRVFEVTGTGEVVWVWLNPSSKEGHREGLYRMIRLPAAQVDKIVAEKSIWWRRWRRKLVDQWRRWW